MSDINDRLENTKKALREAVNALEQTRARARDLEGRVIALSAQAELLLELGREEVAVIADDVKATASEAKAKDAVIKRMRNAAGADSPPPSPCPAPAAPSQEVASA
jgi:archaellum component FlaC